MPVLPELGPALGRLCAPPGGAPLDDLRLALATSLLDLAGTARGVGDDAALAVRTLAGHEWQAAWERAVHAAAERAAAGVTAAFAAAAAESRYPARRRAALAPTADERRAIHARLGAGGAPLLDALAALDAHAPAAARPGAAAAFDTWWAAAETAAHRLESAWLALEAAYAAEPARWRGAIAAVHAWRRPAWPLWAATVLLVAGAGWLGLVLGGWLPVPDALRPLAEFWWRHLPWA